MVEHGMAGSRCLMQDRAQGDEAARANPSRALRQLAQRYAAALEESLGSALISVILFGSVARGEAGPICDVDLLVVVDHLPASRFARQEVLRGADARIDDDLRRLRQEGVWADVRPILKTPEEARRVTPLYLDLVEDARILIDRGGFFAGILERLRASLRTLGARRIRRGRFWYWDLKPDYRAGETFEI